MLIVSCVCVLGARGEPETSARQPGLVAFMTGYCDAVLYVHADTSGEAMVDYWKVDPSNELVRDEVWAYLKARNLIEGVTAERPRIFFIRSLTEKELSEQFSFATTIKDEEERAAFNRQRFKYGLVKMISVSEGTVELMEQAPVPGSDVTPVATKYTLNEFRALVQGYVTDGATVKPPAYTPGSAPTSAQP